MWALIIAIAVGGRGVAIDHVDGFTSKQACDVALAQFWQHEDAEYHSATTLVCVPKG